VGPLTRYLISFGSLHIIVTELQTKNINTVPSPHSATRYTIDRTTMSSTILRNAFLPRVTSLVPRRALSTTHALRNSTTAAAAPVATKKPIGAFRGGIFGFLLGSTLAGVGSYVYVYEEYRVASELLTEDIDGLRTSVQRLELHLRTLEDVIATAKGKK